MNPIDVLKELYKMQQVKDEGNRISEKQNPANNPNKDMWMALNKMRGNMSDAEKSFTRNFFPKQGEGYTKEQGTANILKRMLNSYNKPHSSEVYNSSIQPTYYAPVNYGEKPTPLENMRDLFLQGGGNVSPSQPNFKRDLALNALGSFLGQTNINLMGRMPSFGLKVADNIAEIVKKWNVGDEIFGSMLKGTGRLPIDRTQKVGGVSNKLADFITQKGYKADTLTNRMNQYQKWNKPNETSINEMKNNALNAKKYLEGALTELSKKYGDSKYIDPLDKINMERINETMDIISKMNKNPTKELYQQLIKSLKKK